MGREFELKFAATQSDHELLRRRFDNLSPITMETTYYDTPERAMGARRETLRRRYENGTAVYALKTYLPDGSQETLRWQVSGSNLLITVERDGREAHARFVLSGEELAHQHRETLYLASDIADTALRLMLPEDATPEQHLATAQRSVALRRAALGEGYAGVYEVPLIKSLRNVIYAALTVKQRSVADEAWHELVAIVERQMQQRLAPEEVVWSESVNQAPDQRYPAPEVLTLPVLTKMLGNDTFSPYHESLAALVEQYREVFMV